MSAFQKKLKEKINKILQEDPPHPAQTHPNPNHICYLESVMPTEIPGSEHTVTAQGHMPWAGTREGGWAGAGHLS